MKVDTSTLIVFIFIAFALQNCGEVTSSESTDANETKESNVRPKAQSVAYRPTINIVSGSGTDADKTVSSSLNHFTSLSVGLYQEQYAVVIKTNKDDGVSNYTNIPDQAFADEIIEDEIVEETIKIPSKVIVNNDLVVAEGPGVSPFGEKEKELLAEKGASPTAVAPASSNGKFDINNIDAAYLLGKFNPATHGDFTKISTKYASRPGMYARKDVYDAFLEMYKAAKADGFDLTILSATRSFSGQKSIWEAKWTGRRAVSGQDLSKAIPFGTDRAKKILEYSAMPGTSRHHWGTDLDLCALNNTFFESGKGLEIYNWLNANARNFGFFQPYTDRTQGRITGHNEEKWHWSYLPIALPLTKKYTAILSNDKINGFLGQESAPEIKILENYVLGINPECK